jgi:hypothetical protein
MPNDPTRAEVRNPTVGGETVQESVDRMAGGKTNLPADPYNPSHPSATAKPKPVGPSIHPTAKGVYGAPIQAPIVK